MDTPVDMKGVGAAQDPQIRDRGISLEQEIARIKGAVGKYKGVNDPRELAKQQAVKDGFEAELDQIMQAVFGEQEMIDSALQNLPKYSAH